MIESDQKPATFVAASALTLSLFIALQGASRADTPPPAGAAVPPSAAALAAPAPPAAPAAPVSAPLTVTLVAAGRAIPYATTSKTVAGFLAERNVHAANDDYLSSSPATALTDGMRVAYRPGVPIVLYVGADKRVVRSSAETVGDLLHEQNITPTALDEVSPVQTSRLLPNDVVRVVEVQAWTAQRRVRIAPKTTQRLDADLKAGTQRTLQTGSPGVREATVHYVRINAGPLRQTVLASRLIRAPRPRIVARGLAAYTSLAHVAEQGFASALHFAGSALHVIATAYTAGCYGCNGITTSGVRAGFGVVAVDPRLIPLGTHLFVPGYGRAVAGDTGGAIKGRRVDLGMDTVAEALRFGRQPMTVYVLK